MTLRRFAALSAAALVAACSQDAAPPAATTPSPAAKLAYPAAKTVEQVDDFHGTKVADPYRWMEDLDSPELATWIAAQNELVAKYLADTPRDRIKARLTELWNHERFGVRPSPSQLEIEAFIEGGRYFYTRNDGLQNQSPWYWQDGADGEAKMFLDPNTLSADGTVALAEYAASHDGKRFAYSISDGGSDWRTIRVRDVESGTDLDDEVKWAKFTGIEWSKSGDGFYYARYDEPKGENELKALNKFQKLYFHELGTPQSEDTLVYERKDQPDWGFGADVSADGKYLVISVSLGTDERNLLFYKDLGKPGAKVVELLPELEATYDFIGSDGNTFYVRTDQGAERYRVVAIDLARPHKQDWRDVVPQSDATLEDASIVNRQVVASWLKDAHSVVTVHTLDGEPVREIALPGLGTVDGLHGGMDDKETLFAFSSYTAPATLYRLDAESGEATVFRQPKVAFDASPYETTQQFFTSKDGTKVPMFVTARKGIVKDGSHPTLLFGYGGFNVSYTPLFQPTTAAWLEMGGVYAVVNLRGGGEYGKAWHEAGMKTKKQNVFDDFAAAAEYLVAEKYTRPDKLAITGRSNGGLLVGATMLQRPELFGAAVPQVGVMDMLRFREFTIGWAWESDYGSVKDPAEFAALYAYSPLHNIEKGKRYPATLVTTADRDDRVFPAHSFKFAAALQAAYEGDEPMLIRVDTRAGHGSGKPTGKLIEEWADIFAFLAKTLDVRLPDSFGAGPASAPQ
jgi:prolyl oligopeptidase